MYKRQVTGAVCTEITDSGVKALINGEERTFEADTVIIAAGLKSRSKAVEALRDTAPYYKVIGDCLKPRKILEAVAGGFDAAMTIE